MTIENIKNLVLIALASDEQLLETLVLKGGNAIYLLEKDKQNLSRASYDFDFSIEDDFDGNLEEMKERIQKTLENTFDESGFVVFDYVFNLKPGKMRESLKEFWGGYNIQFKITTKAAFEKHKSNFGELRKHPIAILPNSSTKI